jgi:hypothetical protein
MKKYLLGVFAIALAIGFSAFTSVKTEKNRAFTSYYFTIDASTGTVITSGTTWINDEVAVDPGCAFNGTEEFCKVQLSYPSEVETQGSGDNIQFRPINPEMSLSGKTKTRVLD